MAGIYLHIPFCKKKCFYCNFYSLASSKNIDAYINAIKLEIKNKPQKDNKIETIYFGGGTPSIIHPEIIQEIIEVINEQFRLISEPEITIEVNPDDIQTSYIKSLSKTSVNRLSIGIQSLHDYDLQYIGRTHNANQAIKALELFKNAGYKNISVDIVTGIPYQTSESLIEDIDKIIKYDVQHISAYSLTLEKHTILEHYINKGIAKNIDEEQQLIQFEKIRDYLISQNFIHYELSNYAKDGYISTHNSSYWKGKHYFGYGASAHSYNYESRSWNTNNVTDYISSINTGVIPEAKEILTIKNKFNEYIMTSLRTMWGCDTNYIISEYGNYYYEHIKPSSAKYIKSDLLYEQNGIIYLSKKGQSLSDGIISSLFLVEE